MPTLFLHIGAPKTGSTYIQSSLRLSRENLSMEGLDYPEGLEQTGLGPESLTRGNGFRILHKERVLQRAMKDSMRTGHRGVVFSNEDMWFDLQNERFRQVVQRTSQTPGFEKVKILLFLRNPVEFAVSGWHQSVKSLGNTRDLNAHLTHINAGAKYKMAIELIESLRDQGEIDLTLLNYSVVKDGILTEVERWLEVPKGRLVSPVSKFVNRSLDMSETSLQMELNRILGPGATMLAKSLTEGITDVYPMKTSPSIECQEGIWEESKPWIDELNTFLPEGQEFVFDRMTPTPKIKEYRFSEQQIKIIAEVLGGEIKRIWDSETRAMPFFKRLIGRRR